MATVPQWPPEVFHWLLFTLVVLIERYLPLPANIHPATAWRTLATAMAAKVHRPARSRSQQRIAGLMATLTLTLPWLAIAALLLWMAELNWLFSALVLYLCLGSQPAIALFSQVNASLLRGQKQLAREQIQPLLQRDCATLSTVGIRKALAEGSSRRLVQLWLAPLFWFILGGPLAALAYRMLYELTQAWPVMRRHWHDFGYAANALQRSLAWPAIVIGWSVLGVYQLLRGKVLPWQVAPQPFLHRQDAIWWRALAIIAGIRLSGPVKLDQQRCQRPHFNYAPDEPQATDLKRLHRYLLQWQIAIWLILSVLFLTGLTDL